MSDIKSFEPLWGVWRTESLIGEGSYGKVYRAVREEFGKKYYSAIKHISIPSSEEQIKEAIAEGLSDDESIKEYFDETARSLISEIALMDEVKGNTNIVSYEDHLIIPKVSGIGYDIIIRMELLTGLNDVLRHRQFTNMDVIKLGIDLCSALEVCEEKGIIHRDIKPSNIFVNDLGDYKLGDFGVARQLEHTTSGMSKKGTYIYMAPEVYRGESANFRADMFSLGIVMYRLLNGNRAPFLPVGSAKIKPGDNKDALIRRMAGEPLPAPAFADEELAEIILKATQFDRTKRFSNPTEFKEALQSLQSRTEKGRTIPVIAEPTDNSTTTSASDETESGKTEGMSVGLSDEATEKAPIIPENANSEEECPEDDAVIVRRTKLQAICAICAAVVLLIGTILFFSNYIIIAGQIIKKDVTELDLSNYGVTRISSLSRCKYLQIADLRGNEISAEDIAKLSEKIPECEIIWTVDISGYPIDSNISNLDLSGKQIDDFSNLVHLKELSKLNMSNCGVSDEDMLSVKKLLPDCHVIWTIDLYGKEYYSDITEIDLSSLIISDPGELKQKIKYFDQAKSVDLSGCTLSNDSLMNLRSELNVDVIWSVQMYGNTYKTNTMSIDLSTAKISSIEDLQSNMGYFNQLQSIDLSGSKIDNELLADFRDSVSPVRVVWTIPIGDTAFRTDTTELLLSNFILNTPGFNIKNIDFLRYFTELRHLDLGHVEAEDYSVLSELTDLKYLNLLCSSISDISCLETLVNLEELNLIDTNISNIAPVVKLPNLKVLTIGQCYNIKDLSPLSEMKQLERLWLNDMVFSDLSALYDLPNLKEINCLYYTYSHFGNIPTLAKELEKLESLEGLIIDIGPHDISVLSNLKNLTWLSLNCNRITDKGIESLGGLSKLNMLDIRSPELTEEKVAAIKKVLPKCKVNPW